MTTQSVVILQAPILTATATVNNITCNGANNGSISVSPGGGNLPYTFSWLPGGLPGGTTGTVTGLAAGIYTLFLNGKVIVLF